MNEIPQLLSGSREVPLRSNIGSNLTRNNGEPHPFPKAILVGGGITSEEYEQIRNAVKEKLGNVDPNGCVWLKSTMDKYPPNLSEGKEPPLDMIVKVAKGLLGELSQG